MLRLQLRCPIAVIDQWGLPAAWGFRGGLPREVLHPNMQTMTPLQVMYLSPHCSLWNLVGRGERRTLGESKSLCLFKEMKYKLLSLWNLHHLVKCSLMLSGRQHL